MNYIKHTKIRKLDRCIWGFVDGNGYQDVKVFMQWNKQKVVSGFEFAGTRLSEMIDGVWWIGQIVIQVYISFATFIH